MYWGASLYEFTNLNITLPIHKMFRVSILSIAKLQYYYKKGSPFISANPIFKEISKISHRSQSMLFSSTAVLISASLPESRSRRGVRSPTGLRRRGVGEPGEPLRSRCFITMPPSSECPMGGVPLRDPRPLADEPDEDAVRSGVGGAVGAMAAGGRFQNMSFPYHVFRSSSYSFTSRRRSNAER
jgi:hypothetical protein